MGSQRLSPPPPTRLSASFSPQARQQGRPRAEASGWLRDGLAAGTLKQTRCKSAVVAREIKNRQGARNEVFCKYYVF